MKRLFSLLCVCMICLPLLLIPSGAENFIKWVDFGVPYESLKYAMNTDIETAEQENHISWIDILALAGCRTGGGCSLKSVKNAAAELKNGLSPEEALGELYQYFPYYRDSFQAVLGGFLGNFAVNMNGKTKYCYGLKAFSPIAEGYGYSHYDDFGNSRSFGFKRKHLGNDLMGQLGTPIVAVEGGVVEALGWNRYGGWRVGIRSFDSQRYYYYAHLRKDSPYALGLQQGDIVNAGDLIGFMGRTGYSDLENTNNIETVHLHFGMELIFDESQKECNSEIWVDVYNIVRLLQEHRSTIQYQNGKWERKYSFVDLDAEELF